MLKESIETGLWWRSRMATGCLASSTSHNQVGQPMGILDSKKGGGFMILCGGEKDVCILELPSWFWHFKMACFRLRNDLSLFLRDLLPRFMLKYISAQGLPTLQAQNYESVDSPIHVLVDPEIPPLHIFVSLPCWKNYVQAKWIQPAWILTRMVLEGTTAAMCQKEFLSHWPFWAMCFAAHFLAF